MVNILSTIELQLPLGAIRGTVQRSVYGDEHYSFEGIPFAEPPLGELRFRAPKPVQAWTGIRDCTKCANNPAQINEFTGDFEGSEDCLYLNVYAKTLSSQKPLPVMIYIYGGAFEIGGTSRQWAGPDCFMMKDIIFVNFNYRLSSLGFLSLEDPSLHIPGNAGLKDQVLALKWVKDNIAHFNGDPENITLFGESAGAASTHYMMCAKQTQGLFQKAILMSGCILNPWALSERKDKAYRLAQRNGYTGENIDRLVLAYLSKLDSQKLVEHMLLTAEDSRQGLFYAFGPTVEPYIDEDCVVPRRPIELAREAWGNELPAMVGITSFEGLCVGKRIKANPNKFDDIAAYPEQLLPLWHLNELRHDVPLSELTNKLLELHFDGQTPTPKDIMKYLHYNSFSLFVHGIKRTVDLRLKAGKPNKTFFYRFDFDSPTHNKLRTLLAGDDIKQGVSHADDLCYMFYGEVGSRLVEGTPEYQTMRRLISMWTAFATKCDPHCEETGGVVWPELRRSGPLEALNISHDLTVKPLPELGELLVWDSLYK